MTTLHPVGVLTSPALDTKEWRLLSPAERLLAVQFMRHVPLTDESGEVVGHAEMITKEEAIALLAVAEE